MERQSFSDGSQEYIKKKKGSFNLKIKYLKLNSLDELNIKMTQKDLLNFKLDQEKLSNLKNSE